MPVTIAQVDTGANRRRNHRVALVWMALMLALVLIAAACSSDDSDDEEEGATGDELEVAALEEQVDQLTEDLEDAEAQVEELVNANEELVTQNETLVTELASESGKVAEIEGAVGNVPSYVGTAVAEAQAAAQGQGWAVTVVDQDFTSLPPGTIIGQSPVADTPMTAGSAVILYSAYDPSQEWQSIQTFSGAGGQSTSQVNLDGSQARLLFSFTGAGENTVTLIDPDDNIVEQLVGVVGQQAGEILIPYSGIYSFVVGTDEGAQWSMDVQKRA